MNCRDLGHILVVILIHLLAMSAIADTTKAKVQVKEEIEDILAFTTNAEAINIGDPWNKETALKVYSEGVGADKVYNLDALDMVMTASMFARTSTAPFFAIQQFLIDPLNKDIRQKIRSACLQKYAGDPWKLLVCTNQSVSYILWTIMGDKERNGWFTACRATSTTVQMIFNSYKIPGAKVSISNFLMSVDGSFYGHSVNTVTFRSPSGSYYGYTFDAAYPSDFYPNTPSTIKYHQINGNLPPANVGQPNVQYQFRPAR